MKSATSKAKDKILNILLEKILSLDNHILSLELKIEKSKQELNAARVEKKELTTCLEIMEGGIIRKISEN
jgi:hypothetical protein